MSSRQAEFLLIALALAGVSLPGAVIIIRRILGKWKLRRVIADIERTEPGWHWENVQARRVVVPPERNGADLVLAAIRLIPEAKINPYLDLVLTALVPGSQLEPAFIQQMRVERDRLAAALDVARRLEDYPEGRFAIAYTRDMASTKFDDLIAARQVSGLLRLDAVLRAEDGEADDALACSRSIFNAARSIGDEPTLIAQRVRLGCRSIAIQCIARALAQGQPSEAALLRTQRLLEHDLSVPILLIAAEGERAYSHRVMEVLATGDRTMAVLVEQHPDEKLRGSATELLHKVKSCKIHAGILRLSTDMIRIARRPMSEWASLAEQWEKRQDKSLVAIREDVKHFRTTLQAVLREQALLTCAVTALAMERYRLRHGCWPSTLAALQPEFLAETLADPYNGQPLRYWPSEPGTWRVEGPAEVPYNERPVRYFPSTDNVLIYTVGLKGVDHGGYIDLRTPHPPEANFGFRLWDVPHRRQGAVRRNSAVITHKS